MPCSQFHVVFRPFICERMGALDNAAFCTTIENLSLGAICTDVSIGHLARTVRLWFGLIVLVGDMVRVENFRGRGVWFMAGSKNCR